MAQDITHDFWQYVEERKETSKIAQRVYNWLNYDNLGAVLLDGDVFWTEKTCSHATFPNYAFDYVIRWGKAQGYIHLSEIKTRY